MGGGLFCCWDVLYGADVEWGLFSWEVRDGLWGRGFGCFCFLLEGLIMVVLEGSAFWGAGTVAGRGCIMCAIAIVLRGDRGLEHIYRSLFAFRFQILRSFFGAIEDWNPLI